MRYFFIYLAIIAIFFITGRVIANTDKPIFKSKYNNRLINNYYGNIIASTGFIIICAKNFGITNFLFFAMIVIALLFSYFLHVMDYTGENFDGALKFIIYNDKRLVFQKQMFSLIIAILISGWISSTFLSPILIKNNYSSTTEPTNNQIDMNPSIEQYEENFDDYFY